MTVNPAADGSMLKSTWSFHQNRRRPSLSAPVIGTDDTYRSSASLSLKWLNLSTVYGGQRVLPVRYSDLQICVANTADRLQVLKKGNILSSIEPADIVSLTAPEPTLPARPTTVNTVSSIPTCVQGIIIYPLPTRTGSSRPSLLTRVVTALPSCHLDWRARQSSFKDWWISYCRVCHTSLASFIWTILSSTDGPMRNSLVGWKRCFVGSSRLI